MNIKLETITPEKAQLLLATNEELGDFKNRNSSALKVAAYANDIRKGNWKQTHQPIALYWDKVKRRFILVDGKHRCKAVVEAGISVDMLVAYYPTRAAAMAALPGVDVGSIRKAKDISVMTNATKDYHTARNGAARLLANLESGAILSTLDTVELASQTTELFDAVHHHEWRAPVIVTAAFMFAHKKFGSDVSLLSERIAKGEDLDRQEAFLHRVVFDQFGHKRSGGQVTNALKIVRAIEACVKGQTLSRVHRYTRSEYANRLDK